MRYFAGANTRKGFVSLFDETFSDCEKLYIIKGSSGCGKSTMMKKIAHSATEKGLEVDYIHCSADPGSLDGIIIPKLKVAVADGTSPHLLDVKYPCVRETIINLGDFWDSSKLLPQREKIISLTDQKSLCYRNAYKSLYAVGNTLDIATDILKSCLSLDKLYNYAFKLTEKFTSTKNGNRKQIFATSFSREGFKTLKVFENIDTLYRISGKGSEILLSAIEKIAIEENRDCIVAYSPIDPKTTEAIYFPYGNVLITNSERLIYEKAKTTKTFSTSRFVDNEKLSSYKIRLGGMEKLYKELLTDAKNHLEQAKNFHDQIENIYISAMDFQSVSLYTEKLTKEILKS